MQTRPADQGVRPTIRQPNNLRPPSEVRKAHRARAESTSTVRNEPWPYHAVKLVVVTILKIEAVKSEATATSKPRRIKATTIAPITTKERANSKALPAAAP